MNFRELSAWSIRNPIVPIVMFAALLILGTVSFLEMKIQNMPDIELPIVIVDVSQPGAAPTEIETQVTQKIEAAVRSISGVSSISSTVSEGDSETMVEFQIGEDTNAAVSEVKNAVDQIRGELPDGILEPQVFKVNASADPIAYMAISADDMTMEQLSWFVDDTVSKRLLSIDGMASVERVGGVSREIMVTLDPARMQAFGVTAPQVNQVLRQLNMNAAGGRAEIGGMRQSVRVLASAHDAFALSQTEIALGDGRSVKLGDIAHVEDSHGEITSMGKIGGRQVVVFALSRARGASDVAVYDAAVGELKKLSQQYPGIHLTRLFCSVDYTRDQYKSSLAAMVEGAILAVIVVFLFLRDWRATVVSALAIPLSAIPTFWFMNLLGFTLNGMSLTALSLVAGVLVDDAIVEIENIVRHMRMGKTAYQASIDAADEIGLAVVATTFSIVAVFLPVGLMPGVSGQIFKAFGLTVVVSVLMSLLVARMVTPMVAAYFLHAAGPEEHAGSQWMRRYMRVLHWSLDTAGATAHRAKTLATKGRLLWRDRFAARLRDHRMWMMGIGVGAMALTVLLFMLLPSEMFPDVNSDVTSVTVDMVPGTTLAQTETVADSVAKVVSAQPDVVRVLERIHEGDARLFVTLSPDRKRTTSDFERAMTPVIQNTPDARVAFQSLSNAQGSGTGRPISVMLSGSDPVLLEDTAARLVEQMKGLHSVVAPRISGDLKRPEVVVSPRLDLAANMGVTTASLSQAVRIATMGEIDQNAAKFSLADRQVPIRVRLPDDARRDIDNIRNLPVQTESGVSVPLSRVAEISFGSGPTAIERYNQERRIFIGADLAPGVVKGTAMDEINKLPVMVHLPDGISNAPFGSDRWQREMGINLALAVPAGILLVFAVLVLLYHRVVSPMVNMASLFLAPLGGLLALMLFGQPLSMAVYIGLLMLLGIVAKNSILLIDFAIEEMGRGTDKLAAIMEAGHKRAQPIVMTTVAMTAGMVPCAISLSGDGAWRAPMGTVVIGGLIVSTLLTLLIVPAGFSLADGFEKRLGPKMRRALLTYDPAHGRDANRRLAKDAGDGGLPAE